MSIIYISCSKLSSSIKLHCQESSSSSSTSSPVSFKMSASPSSTSDLRPRVEEVTDSEDDIPLAKMKTKIQNEAAQAAETKAAAEEEDEYTGITFVDMLRFIVLAILTSSGLSYLITQESFTWGYKPWAKFHAMRHYFVRSSPISHRTSLNASFISNNKIITERPHKPHSFPTSPLQRHRPFPPHLPRRQRHNLRRHFWSPLLRSRSSIPLRRRLRSKPCLHNGLFPRRPHP